MAETKTEWPDPEELEKFLSVFRHNLGNLVNTLKITLEVFRENLAYFDRKKKEEYLERALAVVDREQDMIQALKSYSKFTARRGKEVSLVPFIEEFLATVSHSLKQGNIQIVSRFESAGRQWWVVQADEIALHRVLEEVFQNACDALKERVRPRILLEVSGSARYVLLRIKDNGPGFQTGDLTKAFVPLYTNRRGRSGMGLPIARKLVREMGGDMKITSNHGRGTEVLIRLRPTASLASCEG